ncbi:MAG: endonuclease/exonuclease/phosphatase family protein [Phycisphaerales bacterium]
MTERAVGGAGRRVTAHVIAIIAWVGVVAFVGAHAFALAWRPDPTHAGRLESGLTFFALVVQAFTFHEGVALLGVCLLAVALRRKMLAAVVGLLVLGALGPMAWSALPGGEGRGADDLVVMSANVLFVNDDPTRLIEQVREVKPDVLLIEEYQASWSEALHAAIGAEYAYSIEAPSPGATGEAVFSRLPFVSEPVVVPGVGEFAKPEIRIAVEHGGKRVEIVCVHLTAPLHLDAVARQRREVGWMAALVEARMSAPDAPDAIILGGDFNAPYASTHLRELRWAGLHEAQAAVGDGRGATWRPPTGWMSWAPRIRIDQLMYRGRIRATSAHVGGETGSDHLPVWATFRLE